MQYDEFFRPVIFNPFRGHSRSSTRRGRTPDTDDPGIETRCHGIAPELVACSFTVLRLNAFGVATDVAVGTMVAPGGYVPGPGSAPPPPPPPPEVPYDNVVVEVKYSNADLQAVRVPLIIDVGDDPSVGGARKVLLDGATPAWGAWTQTATGERQFEVYKTQQFPGMEAPTGGTSTGRLPAAGERERTHVSSQHEGCLLILAAAVVAMLVLGAIVSIPGLSKTGRTGHPARSVTGPDHPRWKRASR